MTPHIGTASGIREVIEIHVGTAGGPKAVTEGWIGTAAGKRQFYSSAPPLTVGVSPDSLVWTPDGFGGFQSSGSATVSVSGGIGPFSYGWSIDSGMASIDDESAATTAFESIDGTAAIATCTVTDETTGQTGGASVAII